MPSWHKYSWMAEFIRHIPNYRQNTIETVRLAIESRRHMFAIAERENIDFDLQRCGILHFYRDKGSFDKGLKVNGLLNEGGLDRRPVTTEEIRQIEPKLKGAYYGGFFTPSDSTGDIHKFTRGLADVCARRGVRFVYDAEVESIVPKSGGYEIRWIPVAPDDESAATDDWHPIQVDGVVICAGTASRKFAAMLGDRLNISRLRATRSRSISTAGRPQRLDREHPASNWRSGHQPLVLIASASPGRQSSAASAGIFATIGSSRLWIGH